MTYKINKTDGSLLTEIVDSSIDQTATDLTLVGKNVSGYGELLNENFVKLLENFASTSEPNNPITGQIWFDTAQNRLKVYDGNGFRIGSGPLVTGTPPTNLVQGDIWIDSAENQLYFYDGSDLKLAGPVYKDSQGISGFEVKSIYDSNNALRTLVYLWVGSTLLGIFSKYTFELQPRDAIPGFSGLVRPGFNAGTLTGMKFHVRSTSSDALIDSLGQTKTADDFMSSTGDNSVAGTITIQDDTPLILGPNQNFEIKVNASSFRIDSNNSGQDYNLRVKNSSGQKDAITIKSLTERVGIFNSSPTSTLDVGGITTTYDLVVTNSFSATWNTFTINTVDADEIIEGETYRILTLGTTDFTAIGASSNTVGETFEAISTGTGTGTVSLVNEVQSGYRYIIDTTNYAAGIKLPASPTIGSTISIVDGSTLGFSVNNLKILRNGSKINGATSDLTVSTNGAAFALLYTGSNRGWVYDRVAV